MICRGAPAAITVTAEASRGRPRCSAKVGQAGSSSSSATQ